MPSYSGPMAASRVSIRRIDFGYFVRPGEETASGQTRVDPVLGYVVEHPGGVLLVDSGMGSHPEAEEHYRPRRRSLQTALAETGMSIEDVTAVANCHLHFDHCGGNPKLPGRPIFTQRIELEQARSDHDYTLPELIDAPGLAYEVLDGEVEVFDGVLIIPTPGHTAGHQSVVIRQGDGTIVVAGQSHDTSSEYGAAVLAWRAHRQGHPPPLPTTPAWIDRLQQLDPRRVVFAHDHAVWEP
jgi:N-acyl homoserine lactone hydrolase